MKRLVSISLLALAACGAPDLRSDWERKNEAQLAPAETIVLPAYPRERDLVEFSPGPTSTFRFFVDRVSLSVGRDEVRYSLVARSDAGAETVSYEGIRCASSEARIYAIGRDGAWARRTLGWRKIERGQSSQYALFNEYFCPLKAPIANREEGLDALRRGGHPFGRDPNYMPHGDR